MPRCVASVLDFPSVTVQISLRILKTNDRQGKKSHTNGNAFNNDSTRNALPLFETGRDAAESGE